MTNTAITGSSMFELTPWLVYQNMYAMLGYRKINAVDKQMTLDEFTTKLNSYEYVTIRGKYDRDSRIATTNPNIIMIMIQPESRYSNKSEYFKRLLKNNTIAGQDLMIVTENGLTAPIEKYLEKYKHKNPQIWIEDHKYMRFMTEIPKSGFVPPHEIVPQAEAEEMIQFEKIRLGDTSKILWNEAMATWLGVRPKQLVRIYAPSENAGKVIYYRYCI